MENMGENFANSCRREDKMRNRGREVGIVLKRKRRRRRKNTIQKIPMKVRIFREQSRQHKEGKSHGSFLSLERRE